MHGASKVIVCGLLILSSLSLSAYRLMSQEDRHQVLLQAIYNRDYPKFERNFHLLLKDHPEEHPDTFKKSGATFLCLAATYGMPNAVRLLLAKGANPQIKTRICGKSGWYSPVDLARWFCPFATGNRDEVMGHAKVIELLSQ